MGYDAFLSYSHAADGRLAPALQSALQRFATPWYRPRGLRVFRDETGLSTSPHLWSSIAAALDSSRWFVLLASPDASNSEWVEREIEHWIESGSDHILPVVTAGDWEWDDATSTLSGDAVPAPLVNAFAEEPRFLDLRWITAATTLDLRNGLFRSAVSDLAATVHGVPKDQLESEDIRQSRRARRLVRAAVAALVVLLVLSLTFAGYARTQRDRASRNARVATERLVEATAAKVAVQSQRSAATNVDLSLFLAAAAYDLHPAPDTQGALATALDGAAHLRGILYSGPRVVAAAADPVGVHMLIGRENETLDGWGAQGFNHLFSKVPAGAPIVRVALSTEAKFAAVQTTTGAVELRDGRSGAPLHSFEGGSADGNRDVPLAFSPDGATLAFGSNPIHLVDTATGALRDGPRLVASTMTFIGLSALAVATPTGVHLVALDHDGASASDTGVLPDLAVTSVSAMASDPKGAALVLGTANGDVVSYSAAQRRRAWTAYAAHGALVRDVAVSSDGTSVASTGDDGRVLIWDAATGREVAPPLAGIAGSQLAAFFLPGGVAAGPAVVSVSRSAFAHWALDGSKFVHTSHVPADPKCAGSTIDSPVPGTAAYVAGNCLVEWDARAKALGPAPILEADSHHGERIIDAAMGSEGSVAVLVAGRGVELVDAQTRAVRTLRVGAGAASGALLALRPRGRDIALVTHAAPSGHATLSTIDIPSGATRTTDIGAASIKAMAYSPDGRLLVLGDSDGEVRFYDAATARSLSPVARPTTREVDGIAFSPDGRRLAVATGNGTVRLFDVAKRKALEPPLDPQIGPLAGVAYSADSRTLAAIAWSGRLSLWSTADGSEIGSALDTSPYGGNELTPRRGVAFVGSNEIVTSDDRGTTTMLDLDPEKMIDSACSLIATRPIDRNEWQHYFGSLPYHDPCPASP